MAESVKAYQVECMEAITGKIDSGEKHISIVVPTGLGKTGIAISLAKSYLANSSQIAFVVNKMIDYSQILRMVNNSNSLKNIKVLTIRDYLADFTAYEYVLLFDLEFSERKQVQNRVQVTDTVFLSFSSAFVSLPRASNNISMFPVCVYGTKNVLDIRDVRYADKNEVDYVRKDIEFVQAQTETRKRVNKKKKDIIKKRNQRYQEIIEEYEYLQHIHQTGGYGPVNASAIIDEAPHYKELIVQNNKKINKIGIAIDKQEEFIQFQNFLLGMCGFNPNDVIESFGKIHLIKREVEKQLAQSPNEQEHIIKEAQDRIVEIVESILPPPLIKIDEDHYRTYLIDELSEPIWNRLDENSQRFLVTAKVTYDNYQRIGDDQIDYSGVCLLVTKAVEVEITNRFFTNYKKYLKKTFRSVEEWPKAVRERKNGSPTDVELSEDFFTLGDVKHIIGKPKRYNQVFKQYAKMRLYNLNNDREIENEIEKAYYFIEKIRVDYRNPSAHKDSISATSATECMDYVIDVHHMLKEILKPMRF